MDISKSKFDDLGTVSGVEGDGSAEVILPAGKVVADRFEIIGVIGRGGMGTVYEVHDQMREERVALKFMRPELVSSDNARQRFLNEARIAISLSHPHIISVYDVVKYVNTCFLTMELLKGQSLRQRLQELAKSGQPMPLDEALRITQDVAEALAYAHKSTVHRDIKPENIWVLPDGRAKLMDFGIARLQDQTSNLTKTTMVLGTAYYMAPEQLVGAGQVDHRADQYSLGVVFYEMLTGKLPIGRHAEVSDIRKDISRKVDTVIGTMLSGCAGDRYPDDRAVLDALDKVTLGKTQATMPKINFTKAKAYIQAAINTIKNAATKVAWHAIVFAVAVILVALATGAVSGVWGLLTEGNNSDSVRQEEQAKAEATHLAKEKAKQADEDAWASAKKDGKLEDYQAYLSQFPSGTHGEEAKKEVERVKHAEQADKKMQERRELEKMMIQQSPAKLSFTRCRVRAGCATEVIWSECKNTGYRYTGGNCPNGLLDGIVKRVGEYDPVSTDIIQYRQGRPLIGVSRIASNPWIQVVTWDDLGRRNREGPVCTGNNASERANHAPLCAEAARVLGMDAFY